MKDYYKFIIGAVAGAIAGFTYYHFWGYADSNPIRSNPLYMTLYASLFGFLISIYFRKRKKIKVDGE